MPSTVDLPRRLHYALRRATTAQLKCEYIYPIYFLCNFESLFLLSTCFRYNEPVLLSFTVSCYIQCDLDGVADIGDFTISLFEVGLGLLERMYIKVNDNFRIISFTFRK